MHSTDRRVRRLREFLAAQVDVHRADGNRDREEVAREYLNTFEAMAEEVKTSKQSRQIGW